MAEARSLAVKIAYLGMADPGDGVPGTVFTHFPIIEEGSVVCNFSDPTSVDFRAEGLDDPWESFDKMGEADNFEFNIPSPTAEELKFFLGGTVTGGGKKWEAPVTAPSVRKTVKMETALYKGKKIEYIFVNCKITAKMTQFPSSEQTDLLQVRVTKLAAVTAAGVVKSAWSREVKDAA